MERYDEQVQLSGYKQSCDDTTALNELVIAKVEEIVGMLKTDAHFRKHLFRGSDFYKPLDLIN
ncbi:hypothetical protein N9L19_00320 [bacterium]|nr:hypothetical protein [bacterium]